jgi:dihydroorotate dehydrogenase
LAFWKSPRLRLSIPWYTSLVRRLLFRLPPERAQQVAEATLAVRPAWRAVGRRFRVRNSILCRTVAGMHLDNPIGLAAGFDKQCRYLDSLGHLGFGYLVGGTVIPRPAPGNPRPRLLRVTASHSLINSMGFPSDGLRAVEARLRRLVDPATPVMVSVAALDIEGFDECHRALEPLVDAVELNVSSPNTQGLQRFHQPQELLQLLERMNSHRRKPIFVKLPPYQDDQGRERVMSMLRQCLSAGVTGVTAINSVPVREPRLAMTRGGLSGQAIFREMLRVVSELRREAGDNFVINACGGIATGEDAWQALQAGADTVQLFTALVYRGPLVVRSIAQDLAQRLGDQQSDAPLAQRMAGQRT